MEFFDALFILYNAIYPWLKMKNNFQKIILKFQYFLLVSKWIEFIPPQWTDFMQLLQHCFSFPILQRQASNSKKVYLKGVTLKSTGVYRCEISAEEPDFKTVQGEGKLEVVCKYNWKFLTKEQWGSLKAEFQNDLHLLRLEAVG